MVGWLTGRLVDWLPRDAYSARKIPLGMQGVWRVDWLNG
jgi:hypothetical protein